MPMILETSGLYRDQTLGIIGPLSTALPTESEIALNALFEKTLSTISPTPSMKTKTHQNDVLIELKCLYTTWLTSLSLPSIDEDGITAPLIYTYGSFRLGVQEEGADIDVLLVGPACVSHGMFFSGLCEEVLAVHPKISGFSIVRGAFVPICKFNFDGVVIDLIYAQSATNALDESFDIHSDEVVRAVTPQTIRSLNGPRVTDLLLDLVPNAETLKKCIRFIKIWAKRRGIYSNIMGYMGGVSYSIMVARICQIFPKANPAIIISKFFEVYNLWHWPTPVCLNKIRTEGPGDHVVWTREANAYDRIPVITPAYPAQNSTYNVTFSNFTVLKNEIERGSLILKAEDVPDSEKFETLIKEIAFFRDHKSYFRIRGVCGEEDNQQVWFGWVESRIRKFVALMEELICFMLIPFPKAYFEEEQGKRAINFFVGSRIIVDKNEIIARNKNKKKKIDISPAVNLFISHIRGFQGKSKDMDVSVTYIRRRNLPDFVKNSGPAEKKEK